MQLVMAAQRFVSANGVPLIGEDIHKRHMEYWLIQM
jgi:hypothetical protein